MWNWIENGVGGVKTNFESLLRYLQLTQYILKGLSKSPISEAVDDRINNQTYCMQYQEGMVVYHNSKRW